jgi:hypothetical protein
MATIPSKRGFGLWRLGHEFRFICRSYPLVRDVSSFWIGNLSSLDANYWTQVSDSVVSNSHAAFAFSWHAISVPAHSFVTRGVIIKFDGDEASIPTLNLTFPQISADFQPSDPLEVTGIVTDCRQPENVNLLIVIDNDLSTVQKADIALDCDSPISFSFIPLNHGISNLDHQMGFYAVTSSGDVSRPMILLFSGVPVGESGGNSGDTGAVAGDPLLSVSSSNGSGLIIGAIGSVTCVGLILLLTVTLYIRAKRKVQVSGEASTLLCPL